MALSASVKESSPVRKVALSLINVNKDPDALLRDVLTLFERISGRKPTPEEIEEARATLAQKSTEPVPNGPSAT